MTERLAGLYLHVPFCTRVCPYCDFAVRTGDRERRRRFVDHLVAELALYDGYPLEFDTVYFGGGTPSCLETEDLARILDAARRHLRLSPATWILLEANPEDVTVERAAGWAALGVGTLSLGIQSLDTAELEFLGRHHDPAQARRSVELAREAGFHTVSIDLIYGLPDRTAADWGRGIDRALELEADHLSCYQLTVHPATRFGLLEKRGKLVQLGTDEQAELFKLTHERFNAAGLRGYEVSQFAAAPEHRSRHNSKYWDHTPYLGLGPSAHSYHDRRRWWNLRRTDPWQDGVARGTRPVDGSETLDAKALALEELMTGLRTYAGIDFAGLHTRWDVDVLETNRTLVERLQSDGLATLEGSRLIPTLDGLAVADGLAPMFDLG